MTSQPPHPQVAVPACASTDGFNEGNSKNFNAAAPLSQEAMHRPKAVPQAVLDAIKWCESRSDDEIAKFRDKQIHALRRRIKAGAANNAKLLNKGHPP